MTQEASSEDFYNNVKLACALILQRKTQEGLAIIDQLQKQRPESAEVPYLMGLVAITMDEYGKALVLIEEAQLHLCFQHACAHFDDARARYRAVRQAGEHQGLVGAAVVAEVGASAHRYEVRDGVGN